MRLKTIACILAGLPLAASILVLLVDPTILRILLPFREVLIALCSLQVALSTAMLLTVRRTGGPIITNSAVGLLAIACMLYVFLTEFNVTQETVSFQSHGTRLVGSLYRGKADSERAAIVVVHGSGKFPRRLYRYWAQKLAGMGFDVLVYDKRGVGDSGGFYEGENNTSIKNVRLLAEDASSAVDFVASLPSRTKHIGLFGVSQGGWIAPLAAQMNSRVKFLVLHSGPVVPVGQQNLYERLMGAHSFSNSSLADAERESQSAKAKGFDPAPVLENLDVTALWLYGTADKNVPVRTSVNNIQNLIASGKTFEYREFPGADHLILTRTTRFSPLLHEYWDSIGDWAGKHKDRHLDARLDWDDSVAKPLHLSPPRFR